MERVHPFHHIFLVIHPSTHPSTYPSIQLFSARALFNLSVSQGDDQARRAPLLQQHAPRRLKHPWQLSALFVGVSTTTPQCIREYRISLGDRTLCVCACVCLCTPGVLALHPDRGWKDERGCEVEMCQNRGVAGLSVYHNPSSTSASYATVKGMQEGRSERDRGMRKGLVASATRSRAHPKEWGRWSVLPCRPQPRRRVRGGGRAGAVAISVRHDSPQRTYEHFADTKLRPLSNDHYNSPDKNASHLLTSHTMARHPFVPLSIHVAAASAAGRPHIAATTSASPSPSPPPPPSASHPSWPSHDAPISPHRPFPNTTSTSPTTTPINSTSSLRDPPPNTTPPGQRSQSPSAPRSGDEREDRRKGKGRERDEL